MELNRETDENGKPLIVIGENFSWVKGEVREMSSLFIDQESVDELGVPSTWVREGSDVKLRFLPCSGEDRVFHRGEGWEFFFIYTTVFLDIRVRFPFTEFECGVLSQLKCALTQIYPNAWAFIKGFEILMEYLGTKPLLEAEGVRKGGIVTLNSVQEKTLFGLYRQSYKDFKQMYIKWYSEPVQILGMAKVSEEKTTTGGLKNFFKTRAERGHSAPNVIKIEERVVVNQPAEKKKVPSMKRRRAEEGGSGKKVIELTSSWCCGKEISLEEVKGITEKQKRLHGYVGEEDLTSIWSEHFPISVVLKDKVTRVSIHKRQSIKTRSVINKLIYAR
ncbi:hypothetical protein PIB30_006168 [Stylosanthes scabra]|uniref:Uncharacterized protein n=1 Tax=Stylosanthes scabra TaxID=79078 RepID=A0ABU6X409_9FABA|nr:hypothetical protein [Stylosanthes scabra]